MTNERAIGAHEQQAILDAVAAGKGLTPEQADALWQESLPGLQDGLREHVRRVRDRLIILSAAEMTELERAITDVFDASEAMQLIEQLAFRKEQIQ